MLNTLCYVHNRIATGLIDGNRDDIIVVEYKQSHVVDSGSSCARKLVRIACSNPKRGQKALSSRISDECGVVELRGLSNWA